MVRLATVLICLAAAGAARGEVTATHEVRRGDAAKADFKFEKIPAPSKTDAAVRAKVTLTAGRRDGNGATAAALVDGKLPVGADEPSANFFLQGTRGGRLVFDLGQLAEIKQVNTFSWHPSVRGPQVYKLYGADGSAKHFSAVPGRDADLAKAGWTLVASVDTRKPTEPDGGQYGVAIADDNGAPIGRYRYLLFDIARSSDRGAFGNTFFSEIDIDDGREHEPLPTPEPDVLVIDDKYEITFDASETPELASWVDEKLKPVCKEWYPKIVELLPSERFSAPERFTIKFHKDMRGVAYTAGKDVHCAGPWFAQNLDGEAAGAVVHELVHVVQQYGRAGRRGGNPGWLVEGVADYIRWFLYEPKEKRPRPNPRRAKYTDSYRTTAAFLHYVVETHDKELIQKLNAAMRHGAYKEDLWKERARKPIDDLWADYIKRLEAGQGR